MQCEDAVYSEAYYDVIINSADFLADVSTDCNQPVFRDYVIYYLDRREVPPLSVGTYRYVNLPKCYTILDQTAMEASGILKVHNQRNLELKGRNVLIGFIDTGDCVRKMQKKNWQTGSLPVTYRQKNVKCRTDRDK